MKLNTEVKHSKSGKTGVIKSQTGNVVTVEQKHLPKEKRPRGYFHPVFITKVENLEVI